MQYSDTWKAPICLINGEDSKLDVNKDAIKALAQVTGPMVVVGVVGLYRTGKSFILNLLAGQTDGFPLGGRTSACTKGLWIWLVDHPTRKGYRLVLLDSEGLGDVLKGDENHDMWIFTLTVLLSSTMVYNSKGTIDEYALGHLHFVTKVAQHIKVKTDGEDDSEEFLSHFPSFIWAVRDFTLMHDEGGPERYLESVLESKEGKSDRAERYNQPRKCIRRYFPSRTCFCFPFPLTDTRKIGDLEHMKEHQLADDFREVANQFKDYILENAKPKMVQNQLISGTMFGGLVNSYVEALQKGEAPCIQNAVQTTATVENTKAIEESLEMYMKRMTSVVKLPTGTPEVMSQHHAACEKEAIGAFLKRAVFDSDCTFQKSLQNRILSEMRQWCQRNEKASLAKCEEILDKESKIMHGKLQRGDYMVAGGYQLYLSDLSVIEDKFKATQNKGVKAAECWDQFKKKKDDEGRSIMFADKNMTEQKKQLEEERKQNEAKERQIQLDEDFQRRLEQEKADEKRSKEEHQRQQHEKKVEDKDRLMEELAELRKENERIKKEGLRGKAGDMDRRMYALEKDVEKAVEASQPGFVGQLWNAVTSVPTGIFNAVGNWWRGS